MRKPIPDNRSLTTQAETGRRKLKLNVKLRLKLTKIEANAIDEGKTKAESKTISKAEAKAEAKTKAKARSSSILTSHVL